MLGKIIIELIIIVFIIIALIIIALIIIALIIIACFKEFKFNCRIKKENKSILFIKAIIVEFYLQINVEILLKLLAKANGA